MKNYLKILNSSNSKKAQFLRFCLNGCLAVGVQYVVFWVLIHWIDVNVAHTVGYIVSFVSNFVITSYWTFHSRPSWKRLTGFGGSHLVNFFIQLGFLNLYLWLGVPKEWAELLAMASAVPINFAMLRWVFKKKSPKAAGEAESEENSGDAGAPAIHDK